VRRAGALARYLGTCGAAAVQTDYEANANQISEINGKGAKLESRAAVQ
jgi:hypothetical protein